MYTYFLSIYDMILHNSIIVDKVLSPIQMNDDSTTLSTITDISDCVYAI